MKTRSVLEVLMPACLLFGSSASGDDRLSTTLTPDQVGVLGRARYLYGQDWRVMTSTIEDRRSTVIFLGQSEKYSAEELEMVKEVVDQFEHFAVQKQGETNSEKIKMPSEVIKLGQRTKSVADLGEGAKGSAAESSEDQSGRIAKVFGDLTAQATFFKPLEGGLSSLLGRFWFLAALWQVGSTVVPVLKSYAGQSQSARAIANFVARWAYVNKDSTPLVAIISESVLSRVQSRLAKKYFFETGQIRCGASGCEVVLAP